jgi:exosortase E/protease (VPEID-CTERM system)
MLNRQEAPLGQKALWLKLSNLTLEIVYQLLGWFYSGLVYMPEALVVGTEEFPLEISYACSGIEGVSLIIIFLSLYLWLFRKELRFPHVFWLYPLGIITIWLANSVRIFMLIAVGTSYSSEIASRSLHAQAGWIVFTLVSLGAIIFVHHSRLFSLKPFSRNEIHNNNRQATALLAPFLAQLAIVMVASAFSGDFDKFYPVKIFVTGAVLCYFIKFYRTLSWKWSWQALAIGTGVFAFWILLDQDSADKGNELVKGLDGLSDFSAMIWIAFRMAGSSFVIPIAEELAFRGYLMRKLVANDFENVPFGQYTLLSFLISSLLFGFLHGRWFAGLLAGMCYALALYRNKQLGDAIIAHMTTNFLIAMYVLIFHKWSLWA